MSKVDSEAEKKGRKYCNKGLRIGITRERWGSQSLKNERKKSKMIEEGKKIESKWASSRYQSEARASSGS